MREELRAIFTDVMSSLTSSENPATLESLGLYTIQKRKNNIRAFRVGLATNDICDYISSSLRFLFEKKYNTLFLEYYPNGDPKKFIDVFSLAECEADDPVVIFLNSLNQACENYETDNQYLSNYRSGTVIKFEHNGSSILLFSTKSPIKSFLKNYLYPIVGDELFPLPSAYFNLTFHFDSILIGDKLFLITEQADKFFNLDQRTSNVINSCTSTLTDFPSSTIDQDTMVAAFQSKMDLCRSFHEPTWNKLKEYVETIDSTKQLKLQQLGFQFDNGGNIDNSEKSIQTLVDLVTRKIAFDLFDAPVKTNSSFHPSQE